MTNSFDPYHTWLGIPPAAQPPNYYHLLGIQPFESDPAVIDHAADRQMAHVRGFQNGPHGELSQRLLNEIAAARSRLLDPAKKAEYDAGLRRQLIPTEPPVMSHSTVVSRTAVSRTRRSHRSPFIEIAKIVLGGLTGLALGALLLRQFAGIDLIGSKQKVQAVVTAHGASKSPEDQSTPPRSGSSPSAGESQPSSATPVAAGEQSKPGKNSDTPGEAGTQANGPPSSASGQLTEPSATGPAAKSGLSDDRADVLTAEQPKKQTVPSPERQAAVRAQIDELFKTEDAKQPADKLKLAHELTKVADDAKSSPDERFVLVRRASELAVDGGELAMALELVTHLNREFDFDLLVVKQAAITRFAKSATKEAAIETAVAAEMNLIGTAEQARQYDLILDAVEALFDLCQKPAGVKFRKQASDIRDEARRLQAEWLAFQNAVTKLEESPEDAEANLTAGRWYCLRRHEWEMGLPLLAKGSDKSLAVAANIDLTETTSADEMLSRADQWHAIGTANAADRGFLARAVRWYSQAKPLATGLARAKADKRLAGIAADYASALQPPSLVAGTALAPASSAANDSSASNSSSNDPAPRLGGHTKWVGLGVHTKGPYMTTEFQREELQIVAAKGGKFSANYSWVAYMSKEGSRGTYTIDGSFRGDSIEWQCKSNGAKGNGWLRNDVLFFAWDQPPYAGENIYLPTSNVKVAPFAGKYTVSDVGQDSFQLELRPDGSASKSHLPRVNGAWLGTTDKAWIVWTDGWRDVSIRERARIQKQAFRPGSSLNDRPINTGTAVKIPSSAAEARDKSRSPSIEGSWQDLAGNVINITQKGSDFTATTTYNHPKAGIVRWVMEGSISAAGKIEGNLRHVAPKEWKSQKRVGVLSEDLNTIKGTAMIDGGGTHELVWTRVR